MAPGDYVNEEEAARLASTLLRRWRSSERLDRPCAADEDVAAYRFPG